jgi:hypothetical protein
MAPRAARHRASQRLSGLMRSRRRTTPGTPSAKHLANAESFWALASAESTSCLGTVELVCRAMRTPTRTPDRTPHPCERGRVPRHRSAWARPARADLVRPATAPSAKTAVRQTGGSPLGDSICIRDFNQIGDCLGGACKPLSRQSVAGHISTRMCWINSKDAVAGKVTARRASKVSDHTRTWSGLSRK